MDPIDAIPHTELAWAVGALLAAVVLAVQWWWAR